MSDLSPREQRVRDRAYDLWGRAGKPQGKDGYFWAQAESEIAEAIQRESAGPKPPAGPPRQMPPLTEAQQQQRETHRDKP